MYTTISASIKGSNIAKLKYMLEFSTKMKFLCGLSTRRGAIQGGWPFTTARVLFAVHGGFDTWLNAYLHDIASAIQRDTLLQSSIYPDRYPMFGTIIAES